MIRSSTTAFPHPLANIVSTTTTPSLANKMSFDVTDLLTWEGLGDIINDFRQYDLGLSRLDIQTGPWIAKQLRIPHSYTWSPNLIPKPADWGDHIDVVGFFFLPGSGEKGYQPPAELTTFLEKKDKPIVYIGFGSIVVDDPNKLTMTIFEAVRKAGVRALVSKGWGGLGGSDLEVPEDVYLSLTTDKLADAIEFCLRPEARKAAAALSAEMSKEDGVAAGVDSFHKHLPLERMICDIDSNLLARWFSEDANMILSTPVARVLVEEGFVRRDYLYPYANTQWGSGAASGSDVLTGLLAAAAKRLRRRSTDLEGPNQIVFQTGLGVDSSPDIDESDHTNPRTSVDQFIASPASSMRTSMEDLAISPRSSLSRRNTRQESFSSSTPSEASFAQRASRKKDGPEGPDGAAAGLQAFASGFGSAIMGFFTKPIKGAKQHGIVGAAVGFGQGAVGLFTEPVAGTVALGKGIKRSVTRSVSRSAEKRRSSSASSLLQSPRLVGAGPAHVADRKEDMILEEATDEENNAKPVATEIENRTATTRSSARSKSSEYHGRTSSDSGPTLGGRARDVSSVSGNQHTLREWPADEASQMTREEIIEKFQSLWHWRVGSEFDY
ncbi:hypothetical protein HDU93_006551 [Gonapodya sp. JEL0774]|nr:hypothetical protein HDU93_006551 [Gonapodya sp. JEL0774]